MKNIIKIKSIGDIEKLSEKYGKNSMFKSIHGDTLTPLSIPDLMFYADETDCIDFEIVLA